MRVLATIAFSFAAGLFLVLLLPYYLTSLFNFLSIAFLLFYLLENNRFTSSKSSA